MSLITYQDFVERVDELGFMTLSHVLPGLPSLGEETPQDHWHTGDPDTDPWHWKDRAAQEKRLAYGCILGGHKGFVSARMYPLFYVVYHPVEPMEELWAAGVVSQTTWQLWRLFEQQGSLDTSGIRREMGVAAKRGGSRVDASIRELQRDYHITVSGNRRKVDRAGRPYGWPACLYDRVDDWAPADWLSGISNIQAGDAREILLDSGMAMGNGFSRKDLARALGMA